MARAKQIVANLHIDNPLLAVAMTIVLQEMLAQPNGYVPDVNEMKNKLNLDEELFEDALEALNDHKIIDIKRQIKHRKGRLQ